MTPDRMPPALRPTIHHDHTPAPIPPATAPALQERLLDYNADVTVHAKTTVAGTCGGTANGASCSFPFTAHDLEYFECTVVNSERPVRCAGRDPPPPPPPPSRSASHLPLSAVLVRNPRHLS